MTSNGISVFFKSDKEISQINDVREAREIAEQLRPYTTFVDNPSSVHRTHTITWKFSAKVPDALSGFHLYLHPPQMHTNIHD